MDIKNAMTQLREVLEIARKAIKKIHPNTNNVESKCEETRMALRTATHILATLHSITPVPDIDITQEIRILVGQDRRLRQLFNQAERSVSESRMKLRKCARRNIRR